MKGCALANALLGAAVRPQQVRRTGMAHVTALEARRALRAGTRLRLVVRGERKDGRVRVRVAPERIPFGDPLAGSGPDAALVLETDLMGEIGVLERGASLDQTAYALLSDLLRSLGSADVDRRAFVATLPGLPALARRASAAEEVVVFAAASLTDALTEIGTVFERTTGNRVVFSFGASSDLARQIRAGAPAQVFVSADRPRWTSWSRRGWCGRWTGLTCSRTGSPSSCRPRRPLAIRSAADLASAGRIALADPEAVPAGVYARQWLEQARPVGRAPRPGGADARRARGARGGRLGGRRRGRRLPHRRRDLDTRAGGLRGAGARWAADRLPRRAARAPAGTAARAFVASLRSAESRAVFTRLGFVVLQEP